MRLLAVIFAIAAASFQAAPATAQSTNEAVCQISAGGSGTLVGVSGDAKTALVISAHHVVGGHDTVVCRFRNAPSIASQRFNGRVVRTDRQWDLAAVLIWNPGIPPVVIGDLQRHDGIYSACGYGGGRYSCARGRIFRFDRTQTWTRCGIYPGHSGGGLFDPWGAYCGVTNWNNGSNGPNPGGWARARSGEPLENFLRVATAQCGVHTRWRNRDGVEVICPPGQTPNVMSTQSAAAIEPAGMPASYECRIFGRLFNRGGGGGSYTPYCPDGVCPNPESYQQLAPGEGYGQAPKYTPLTPLANQQLAPQPQLAQPQTPPQVQIQQPPVQPIVVTPQAAQPQAAQPQAAQPQAIQPQAVQPQASDPRIDKLVDAVNKIGAKMGVAVEPEPTTSSAAALVAKLPTLRLQIVAEDGTVTDTAEVDLTALALKEIGATDGQE